MLKTCTKRLRWLTSFYCWQVETKRTLSGNVDIKYSVCKFKGNYIKVLYRGLLAGYLVDSVALFFVVPVNYFFACKKLTYDSVCTCYYYYADMKTRYQYVASSVA